MHIKRLTRGKKRLDRSLLSLVKQFFQVTEEGDGMYSEH